MTRKPTVLCTMGAELRPLLEAKLANLADVRFLPEIDAADRPAALATADVLFCLRRRWKSAPTGHRSPHGGLCSS